VGGVAGVSQAVGVLRFGAALARPRPDVGARLAREWWSTRDPAGWPAPPVGDGRPVVLVPGFLAGDRSLDRLAAWLRRGDFRTHRSGIPFNADCMEPLIARLERRVEDVARRAGRPVLVVGQSRGGTLGRVLAVRRPDLVDTLVTLGSPVRDQLAVSPPTRLAVTAIGALGSLGVPGLLSAACAAGPCCERARGEVVRPFPETVRYVALYSPRDEVVRPDACTDAAAENVEVVTSHVGMGLDAGVWRLLAGLL
jgi:triacylglycerol lipase